MENYRNELIDRVDVYCAAAGVTREYVAAKIVNDGRFFKRLEDGKGCTVDTYLKVKRWLIENTPKKIKKHSASHTGVDFSVNK